jgi:3-oxoacyl-(acyl-carrier-protein) synthase/acyl carrier protein
MAGYSPATVGLFEAHGTGTVAGDTAELTTLTRLLACAGATPRQSAIGSVKTLIGHTKATAGVAGLTKAVLACYHKILPPHGHIGTPNAKLVDEECPLYLPDRPLPWLRHRDVPLRAGVSSFGFGGTNWHVVVEEFVPAYHEALLDRLGARPTPPIQVPLEVVAARVGPVPDYLFVAAGATPQELSASIARLGLDRRRAGKGPWRLAFVARSRADLQSKADLVAKHYRPGRRSPLLEAQGVFATDGRAGDGGPIAGLFPGQGPQYADMLRDLADEYDVVQHTIAEANDVLREVLGETYEQLLFTATRTPDERAALERSLAARSDVVQPVLVTAGVALYRLVAAHGVGFSTLSGHSLGEYAALVGAGALDFAQAIRAAHARGQALRDLAAESGDAGSMAMVTAGADVVAPALGRAGGYVAIANRNCPLQTVVSGDAGAVREVVAGLEAQGVECRVLPIAGAFHSRIAGRVRGRLETAVAALDVRPPAIRVLSSVDLTYYEPAVECGDRVKANLVRQLVEPVDFIGLVDRLHGDGIRVFVEIGPKNALAGFVDDILGEARLHRTLFVNHPKAGEIPQLDRFVAQHALVDAAHPAESPAVSEGETAPPIVQIASPPRQARPGPASGEGIWITGVSVGLPGRSSRVFSDDGLDRLLAGACFIEPISEALQDRLVSKRITRLVKTEEGEPYLAEVSSRDDAVKLAAQRGGFSLRDDFGLEEEWLLNADSSYQLAVAAGLECLRDARIPLQRAYRRTSRGGSLRAGWMLPPALQDDTAVVFASAFPGHGVLYTELERYYAATYGAIGASAIRDQYLKKLQEAQTEEERLQADQWFMDERRARRLDGTAGAYRFNRNFLSDYVCMGNTRFAQLVHARGPNLAVNAACCSTAVALAAAEDMIRLGRARRVVVLAADDVSADVAFEWIGSGFLAAGAAATDRDVADAAIPFDRRRHGMIIGMGAVGFVVEPESAARERGLEPVAELLGVRCANSASHMTRPDADHVIAEIDAFLEDMRARHGIDPREIASNLVYGSHETFTLPTGGIGTVEGRLLKHVFGDRWRDVVVVNTKCATGHAQGAGLEEAIIIKALQAGKIPPVLHSTEIDPELAGISLSSGGPTDREYALRFSAGFGSQVAMVLTRVVTRAADRTTSPARYQAWLDEVTGVTNARVAVVKRVLQVQEAETATAAARVVNQPAKVSDRAPEPRPAAAPALHAATAPAPVAPPPQSGPVPGPPPIRPSGEAGAVESRAPTPSADEITERVIAIIEEKTGYERQYLELDLDLEADLGIDTIKQAQVMGRIRETFALPKDRNIRVKDFPTLRHVVQYVQSKMGGTPVAPAAVDAAPRTQPDTDASRVAAPAVDAPRASADSGRAAAAPPPPPTAEHVAHIAAVQTTDAAAGAAEAGAQAAVLDHVLRIIEKQTGYEREALDLDLDLEADLGIDTIKQAQVMARLRETFSLPREQGIRVKDFPTIRHVVGYITSRTGAGSGAAAAVPDPAGGSDESRSSAAARTPAPAPGPGVQEPPDAPDGVGRMAVEWAAHPLADEQPNLTLDAGWTVLITDDGLGVADALSRRLAGAGATVEVLRRGQDLDVARHRLGRVRALVLLHPLAPEPAPAALDARGWRDVLERKAVASFRAIKAVRGDLEVCVGVTAMSGPFGWRGQLLDPAGAGVAGLLKTLRHEAAGVLVKAVDVDRPATKAEADHLAAVILAEVERGGRRVEVAYRDGSRLVPRVVGAPLDLSGPGKPRIGPQSVIVAIGGSRGVTSAIVKALARRCHPRLVLVATRPLPGNVAELASLDADGLKQLKEKIARGWKARVTGARPIEIERKYAAALQAIDAYRTIETCESAGAAVSYEVCDVRDADRVRDLIRNVVREYGRLDGVIFGAGTIEDKLIEDKTPESFDRVFGVKAEGIFNLYKALDGVPLSFLAAFSSVAGRFGNAGQADYAAGNEVLARFVALMQAARPDARCVVFDWTGWEQVGLAARSGVIELLKDSGFDAVTPEEGARFFHEELAYGDGPVEVAITGASLPIDKDGQMVPALGGALPDLSSHPRSRVFLGAVRAYARGAWLSAATTLEPRTDTWLRDHVIDGAPLMPAVFGIEMMAEAACLLFPDLHLCSVRDLKLHLAVKVLKDRPTTLNVIAVGCAGDVDEERVVRVRVTSNFVGPDGRVLVANRVHYTCEMLLRATPPVAVSLDPGPLATLSAEMPIPPLYGEGGALPHGPTFRVIERVDGLDGTGVVALVAALDETRVFPALNGHRLLTLPFAREAAFQSAGLWGILRHHNFGLPHGCRTLHLFGAPPTGTKLLVRVRPKAVGPVRIEYDIDLLGDDGRLYDRMEGFYTVNPLAAAAESGNGRPGESRG